MKNKKIPTVISLVIVTIFTTVAVGFVGAGILKYDQDAASIRSGINNENTLLAKQNPSGGQVKNDKKVFLFGGMQDNGVQTNQLNDIWVTTNMVNWQQFMANGVAPWVGRSGFGSAYFNNKLWIVGGRKLTGIGTNTQLTNEVWWSSDGLVWNQVTTPILFSPRLATNLLTVYNDGTGEKLWLIGGIGTNNIPMNDIWNSSDGISWYHQFPSDINVSTFLNGNPVVEVFNNGSGSKLYLTGYASSQKTLIYNSINQTWSPSQQLFGKIANHTMKSYSNKLYSFGGKNLFTGGQLINSVKSSSDGNNWLLLNSPIVPWSPRYGHKTISFLNKLWVVGGMDNSNALNEIWSYDTVNNFWTHIDTDISTSAIDNAPWLARKDFGLVVTPLNFGIYN